MNHSQVAPESAAGEPWQRLSIRVVWVDLAWSVLSLIPGGIAIGVMGVEPSLSSMWPLALIAVLGIFGAASDIVRWAFTRYRITDTDVERRTGLLVRSHRSLKRDRIRSVDTRAKLRHRLGGLRVVTVGAGQQTGASESALVLDALSTADADRLRRRLLNQPGTPLPGSDAAPVEAAEPPAEVFATLRPWWVVYNVFSIWAYLVAAGILWSLFLLTSTFGIELFSVVNRSLDWESLGWPGIIVVGIIGGGIIGAMGMAVSFFTSNWNFELARVRSGEATYLRTRRGLFHTREVSRDEARMRGLTISEPLLWRWMGMADTNVITTGLSLWDAEQPTAILPRGPVGVARTVAARVLGAPSPLDAPLRSHPRAALLRRLWWASLAPAAAVALLALPVRAGEVPAWTLWAALAVWVVLLLCAFIAYRALGHAIVGDYLVMRSGLMNRSTSALRRDAVSTVAVSQSVLQRRLGTSTVSAMTAGGWGAYEVPDVSADDAVGLAAQAAPGLIDEFVIAEFEDTSG